RRTGEYLGSRSPDTPRKSESAQAPSWGNAEDLPDRPLDRRVSEWRPMLADQFLEAAAAARTGSAVDEVSRLLWRAHAEHKISDADAKAISEAVQARRAALAGKVAQPKAVPEAPRASRRASRARPRREKM